MTENRFNLEVFTVDCYVENLYVVTDNQKEMNEYQQHQRLTEKEVVDSLNEMSDKIGQLEKENEQLKTLIREAYETERTAIGRSVLKQLAENIGDII